MRLNKYLLLAFIAIFLGGIKIYPNTVSIGLYEIAALFGGIIFIRKIKIFIRSEKKAFFYMAFISIAQLIPLFASTVMGNPPAAFRLLFAFRIAEYFILIPSLYFAAKRITFHTLYISCMIGAISIPFFVQFAEHRWGIFQYSWELGAIYSLLFAFTIAYQNDTIPKIKKILVLIAASSVVAYTNQRSPMIAIILVTAAYGWKSRGVATKTIISFILAISVIFVFLSENRLSKSFEEFNYEKVINVVSAGLLLAESSPSYNSFVYENRSLLTEDGSGDLSFNLRIRKWAYAYVNMRPINFIFGLGPGYFGGAADSSFLRIFFETGIFGIICWLGLLIYLYRKFKNTRLLLFAMIINAAFIDVFYSARTISVFAILFFFLIPFNKSKINNQLNIFKKNDR